MKKRNKTFVAIFLFSLLLFVLAPHTYAGDSCLNVKDFGYHKISRTFWTGSFKYGEWEEIDRAQFVVAGEAVTFIYEKRSAYQELVSQCICGLTLEDEYKYSTTEYRTRRE